MVILGTSEVTFSVLTLENCGPKTRMGCYFWSIKLMN